MLPPRSFARSVSWNEILGHPSFSGGRSSWCSVVVARALIIVRNREVLEKRVSQQESHCVVRTLAGHPRLSKKREGTIQYAQLRYYLTPGRALVILIVVFGFQKIQVRLSEHSPMTGHSRDFRLSSFSPDPFPSSESDASDGKRTNYACET